MSGLGTSSRGGAGYGGQNSSKRMHDTFEAEDDTVEKVEPSQLQNVPLTQPSQSPQRRLRRPRNTYTPDIDALGVKGKGKTRRL